MQADDRQGNEDGVRGNKYRTEDPDPVVFRMGGDEIHQSADRGNDKGGNKKSRRRRAYPNEIECDRNDAGNKSHDEAGRTRTFPFNQSVLFHVLSMGRPEKKYT